MFLYTVGSRIIHPGTLIIRVGKSAIQRQIEYLEPRRIQQLLVHLSHAAKIPDNNPTISADKYPEIPANAEEAPVTSKYVFCTASRVHTAVPFRRFTSL
jgi:hypothetical protein